MTILWIGIAILLAWFAIEGFRHGVVRRLVELFGLVFIFLFASRLAGAGSNRASYVMAGLEIAGALAISALGLLLLAGALSG